MIENITMRELLGKTGKPFQYLMKRTWKIAIPIILVLSFLERGIESNSSLLSTIYSIVMVFLPWYIPFKMLQFLENFYQEPEKEYRIRRVFAVMLAFIAYSFVFIFLFVGAVILINKVLGIRLTFPFAIVMTSFIFLLSILLFSLVPAIYWANNDLGLWKSVKLSFRGIKKYFLPLSLFNLLGFALIFILFFETGFFSIRHIWYALFQYFYYWMSVLWSSALFYLISRVVLGKDISFPEDRRNAVESVEHSLIKEETMNRLKMIVCVAENNLIGDKDPMGNGLLWHSKEELLYYKSITTGQVTLFGENTAKFVPIDFMRKTREVLVLTLESKIEDILKQYPDKDVFLCGGATIYQYYLEHYPIAQVYVSKLKPHVEVVEAKSPLYFPNLEDFGYEVVKQTEHEDFIAYIYEKKDN